MQTRIPLGPPIEAIVKRATAEILGVAQSYFASRGAAPVERARTRPAVSAPPAPEPAPASEQGGAQEAPAATAAPSKKAAKDDLLERVAADLRDAYDGRPVTPERLAFRLKTDRDLVDAALTYLATHRQARVLRSRGKVAYLPVFTPTK